MYVVTFYSFKGGVGRTLALVNAAYEMASSGLNVLVVDFDLEAPGVDEDRWRNPGQGTLPAGGSDGEGDSIGEAPSPPGIVEYVEQYLDSMHVPPVDEFIVDATPDGCAGRIALMPSGMLDGGYAGRLQAIDWNQLYELRDGYIMFEDTRAQWEQLGFDYVLLDSRTGFTDVGGICTRHLPDAVVMLFRLDDQSLRGMETVVESIRGEGPTPRRKRPIDLHFVMAGIPDADDEDGILEARRSLFADRLGIPARRLVEVRHYDSMDLLTQPVYTRLRPKNRLARSFARISQQVRAANLEDRSAVLRHLRTGTAGPGPSPRRPDADFLQRVREHYREDPEVLTETAEAFLELGLTLEAEDLLERLTTQGPLTRDQWLRLAEGRHRAGRIDGALKALQSLFRAAATARRDDGGDGASRLDLVLRALDLLETLGADRASYVADSPVIRELSAESRMEVAARLDLSKDERRAAIPILQGVIEAKLEARRTLVTRLNEGDEVTFEEANVWIVTLPAFRLLMAYIAVHGREEAASVAATFRAYMRAAWGSDEAPARPVQPEDLGDYLTDPETYLKRFSAAQVRITILESSWLYDVVDDDNDVPARLCDGVMAGWIGDRWVPWADRLDASLLAGTRQTRMSDRMNRVGIGAVAKDVLESEFQRFAFWRAEEYGGSYDWDYSEEVLPLDDEDIAIEFSEAIASLGDGGTAFEGCDHYDAYRETQNYLRGRDDAGYLMRVAVVAARMGWLAEADGRLKAAEAAARKVPMAHSWVSNLRVPRSAFLADCQRLREWIADLRRRVSPT